ILATISTDHTIRCSDTATGKEIGKCVLKDGLLSLAFSPDGLLLAVSDQRIRLLNTATNKEVRKFDDSASLLMFSPDGKTLVSGTPADPRPRYSQPGLICLWDVKTGKSLFRLKQDGRILAFSPDSRILVSADETSLHGWDTATGKENFSISVPESCV